MFLPAAVAVILLAAWPGIAAAQVDEAPPREPQTTSLASLFFVSYHTGSNNERSIELFGSMLIWLLLLMSFLNIGLIGHLALTNQRKGIHPDGVAKEAKRLLQAGRFREALELTTSEGSYFSCVLHAGLREASHGVSAMVRGLEEMSDEQTTLRLRRIEYLNVLGQVSPMIGLFGTVYGMILAFRAIVEAGGNADPVLLAAGIGTALVTTFWGLVVAIPALAAYAMIRNKIDELTTEATRAAEAMLTQFRPKPAAPAAPPAAAVEAQPRPQVKAEK
jgi:biopolymer transport protein ExbB